MSVGQAVSLDQLANFLETVSPFQQFLGVKVVKAEAGMVEILLPFRAELLGEREPPYIHGGVIATLLDIAACGAIMSSMGRDVPTIDLRVDYLRPGGKGDLIARGRTVRVGRTLGVADAEVLDQQGKVLALGRGVCLEPRSRRREGQDRRNGRDTRKHSQHGHPVHPVSVFPSCPPGA
jgi:uncharacterized protein (TIGR00369 family)